jgi:SAM-dependent methyltransferase
MTEWKAFLYDRYVSSGQATAGSAPGDVDRPADFQRRTPYLKRLIRTHLPRRYDLRIVDLGCGHGALIHALAEAGYQDVHGVDVSEEQICLARALGIANVTCEKIGSFLSRPENRSFDVVFLMDVLEHLTRPEALELTSAIKGVLNPGGRCILHVPNGGGIFGMRVRYGDLTHELAFTESSAQQIFRAAGFQRVRSFEDVPVVHGMLSLLRWVVWHIMTAPWRVLLAAETGRRRAVLSQNMLVVADV